MTCNRPATNGVPHLVLWSLPVLLWGLGATACGAGSSSAGAADAGAKPSGAGRAGTGQAEAGRSGASGSSPAGMPLNAAAGAAVGGGAGKRSPVVAGSGGAAGSSMAGKGSPSAGAGGTGAGGTSGAPGVLSVPLVPAQGILLGVYYGDGSAAQTDTRIGRKPAVHLTYYAWKDDWASDTARDLADGKIPLVNWEPAGIDFNQIVSGALDSTINARATGAKKVGKAFFLDFAAEMNGDEGWSGNDPALYIAAYRHIHDLFVAAGATNVVWAWCPNVTDVDGGNKRTLEYYPGDAYVDWTGVDGYNWGGGSGFKWQSFREVFADIYPLLAAKGKPILIGEMASDETGGNKAEWIDAIVPALHNDYPLIRGLIWFDIHKERSWLADQLLSHIAVCVHALGERPLHQSVSRSRSHRHAPNATA